LITEEALKYARANRGQKPFPYDIVDIKLEAVIQYLDELYINKGLENKTEGEVN